MVWFLVGFLLTVAVMIVYMMTRRTPAATPVTAAPMERGLSPSVNRYQPSIRAELDDTPAYWDTRFHQLLESLGAPSVVGEQYDMYAFGGDLIRTYQERGYVDCPCPSCRRICR